MAQRDSELGQVAEDDELVEQHGACKSEQSGTPSSSTLGLAEVMDLMRTQLRLAEEREQRLEGLLQTAMRSVSKAPATANNGKTHQISVERPVLLSSATLADFASWEEAWADYATCQHLADQSRATRVSALRFAFDEDIRRFLRQDIIKVSARADVPEIITAVKAFIRSQRNPLLDRLAFYNRQQEQGETFDSFYTSLRELFNASEFYDMSLCARCTNVVCANCPKALRKVNDDILRDRIVTGMLQDEVRHKLLAIPDLTLEKAVQVCRTEEAAMRTEEGMATSLATNLLKKSTYRRNKGSACQERYYTMSNNRKEFMPSEDLPNCLNCGRSAHLRDPCPAANRKCYECQQIGHFKAMCKFTRKQTSNMPAEPGRRVGQLRINRTSVARRTLSLPTQINSGATPVSLRWIPDTGSDVDAIGISQLRAIGGRVDELEEDHEDVRGANGDRMNSVGKIGATIFSDAVQGKSVLHVYEGLNDALLSRPSLEMLGFLPHGWPHCDRSQAQVSRMAIHRKDPTPADIERVRANLMEEFADVFADVPLRPMKGPPMEIELREDAVPSRVHAPRVMPYAYRDQVKQQIDDMVTQGIIEPVTEPTDWCHPIVIVDKKGTLEKRLAVDFKKLNDQIRRPSHPTRTPRDVVSKISHAKYFTKLDARHGYWQVPLAENAKLLTTFMTPWGRYCFLRNPQGLISAGDEFNRRTDAAFDRITNLAKIVDDCLAYDEDFDTHVQRVREILRCAREHGITISPKKFEFAMPKINFCGFKIDGEGWTIDDEKVAAIKDFPVPTNRTDLRSLLGLVNQFSDFTKCLADLATPLRGLLKPSSEFLWEESHTAAVQQLKAVLVSPPVLAFYVPGLPTRLETDASRTKGLGFALWQYQDSGWRLIQCGSRFISDTESRYAMIELECLGAAWAMQKCHVYLVGMAFTLVIDHKPLVPIFNTYSLDQVENPRLQRLLMKTRAFQFHAEWKKGSDHAVADALSRAPSAFPEEEDLLGEDTAQQVICLCECKEGSDNSDINWLEVQAAAKRDLEYQTLINAIQNGFPSSYRSLPQCLKPYWNGRQHLSVDAGVVLKGHRIVVPRDMRHTVLQELHKAHQGIVRTKNRARQVVYWPRLTADIEDVVRGCNLCREYLPSLTKEPLENDRQPSLPFQCTGADLFSKQGWDFLVYVDRLTGWPCISKTGRSTSSHDVILHLRRFFADVGVPAVLYTDGGSQFTSQRFAKFCARWGVRHIKSSPYYAQSNGLAEAAVKAMKTLIGKTTVNGDLDVDEFRQGLLEWRNTPDSSGQSPAQRLYGKPMRSFVLAHHRSFAPEWQVQASEVDRRVTARQAYQTATYNANAHSLSKLKIGTSVDIQDARTKRWSLRGVVVAIGNHRDYYVKLPSGRVYWRNRRFLRPYIPPYPVDTQKNQPTTQLQGELSSEQLPSQLESANQQNEPACRRSTRKRVPVKRLNISTTACKSYT